MKFRNDPKSPLKNTRFCADSKTKKNYYIYKKIKPLSKNAEHVQKLVCTITQHVYDRAIWFVCKFLNGKQSVKF